MPQFAKAKVASPIIFITANVRVAHLPQLKANSLIRRPIVPTIRKIKAPMISIDFPIAFSSFTVAQV